MTVTLMGILPGGVFMMAIVLNVFIPIMSI